MFRLCKLSNPLWFDLKLVCSSVQKAMLKVLNTAYKPVYHIVNAHIIHCGQASVRSDPFLGHITSKKYFFMYEHLFTKHKMK